MVLELLLRPFNYENYVRGQKINMIFGIVLITVLVLGGVGWVVDRWRTRHERGKHAALHRVRERTRKKSEG